MSQPPDQPYSAPEPYSAQQQYPQAPVPVDPAAGQVQPYYPQAQPTAGGYQSDHMAAAMIVGRKSPAGAGILSFFIPGVGQFMNGATVPGVLFLVFWLVNLVIVAFFWWLVLPVLVNLGIEIWACIHAVMGAQKYNQQLFARVINN